MGLLEDVQAMMYGILGVPVPAHLVYAEEINAACGDFFPPCLAYAVANRETIRGERGGLWRAATVVSPDGGHGLFQLTSWVPDDWADPARNAFWAVSRWLSRTSSILLKSVLLGGLLPRRSPVRLTPATGRSTTSWHCTKTQTLSLPVRTTDWMFGGVICH